jgi:hypothetical protein
LEFKPTIINKPTPLTTEPMQTEPGDGFACPASNDASWARHSTRPELKSSIARKKHFCVDLKRQPLFSVTASLSSYGDVISWLTGRDLAVRHPGNAAQTAGMPTGDV